MNDVEEQTNAILAIRELRPLERSPLEHYNRCKRNGNVLVDSADGGWYHSYDKEELFKLYLRLTPKVRKQAIAPIGLLTYIKKLKKQSEERNVKS